MIVALTGKNSYALKAALGDIVAKAEKEIGDIGIERIDAAEAEVDTILQSVQSLPFLAPSKLVVVSNVQANKELLERIEDVNDRTADAVKVALVGPVFDKRSKAWTALKKHAEVHEFNELKPFELPKWVAEQAKNNGMKISSQDAAYLVDRVGADQLTLQSELEKMSLNTDHITREVIDDMTEPNPRSTVFEMLDAAFSGDSKRAVKLYREQRQQRVDPHYVIAMLTWQLQALALAVFANPQTEQTLVSAGQSPYSARKALGLAKRLSRAKIRHYINSLAALDMDIKTSAEPDSALELYLIDLGS